MARGSCFMKKERWLYRKNHAGYDTRRHKAFSSCNKQYLQTILFLKHKILINYKAYKASYRDVPPILFENAMQNVNASPTLCLLGSESTKVHLAWQKIPPDTYWSRRK